MFGIVKAYFIFLDTMKNTKVALVTWWCSWIGKQIVSQLVRSGISVVVNYVHEQACAEDVVDDIVARGGEALSVQADVSDSKSVQKMFVRIEKQFGRLDFLVNNAGIDVMQDLEGFDDMMWEKIVAINLTGKFLCTKYAIPLLKKSSHPKIINIASRLGTKAMPQASAYCCAESAIIMLTKVSALELSKYHISVNTISPGLTRTALSEWVYKDPKIWEKTKNITPMWRIGEPQDIANMVEFLLSDKSDYIDGENINVSGGNILV